MIKLEEMRQASIASDKQALLLRVDLSPPPRAAVQQQQRLAGNLAIARSRQRAVVQGVLRDIQG